MAIDVKLPDLGEGIESADVLDILVREGDQVAKDQGVIEIETDKATADVPSPHAGRVVQIHVARGQTIRAGTTLVTLDSLATQPSDVVPPPQHAAPGAAEASADGGKQIQGNGINSVLPAGPAIRRFAREVGVDLNRVQGTGEGGRITREDVLEVVRQASRAAQSPHVEDAETARERSSLPGVASQDDWGPINIEPATRIRQSIAAKMLDSWSTVPRVTNFDDADITELEKIRQASKAEYAAKGLKLTTLPFIIKAVSIALREHPLINASLDMENAQIIYKRYIHIGVAVDTERGLVVPVIRDADRLGIADLARQLARVLSRVHNKEFGLDELRGGTFTISNLGSVGGAYSTPIVNTPEVAILLVGRSRKMPVVVDDQIAIRLMLPLSLSYDHRLVDGATAARFLNDVIAYLEEPSRLLLAL
jgi:pyruvate dehydrogenase E2 component (dihydrolipoamide acetyltransferase)